MNQPELGKKIAALRNEKGLTQEELVAKCNISVRTIQRIESGEVIPRSYTLKSIFNALEFNYESVFKSRKETTSWQNFKNIFQIISSKQNNIQHSENLLTVAWIFGVVYFVVSSIELFVEYQLEESETFKIDPVVYMLIKITSLFTFFLYFKGFIWLGIVFKNYLIKIVATISIIFAFLMMIYDIIRFYFGGDDYVIGDIVFLFAYGFLGIFFGFAIIRLKSHLGNIAEITGILEIIASFFILTILLALFGLILYIPVELFKIIVLYKAIEIIKTKLAFEQV
jgi:transcriptional regulator with XRE-family HTH domain